MKTKKTEFLFHGGQNADSKEYPEMLFSHAPACKMTFRNEPK